MITVFFFLSEYEDLITTNFFFVRIAEVSIFPRIKFFHAGMVLSVVNATPTTRLSFESHSFVEANDAQCFPNPEPLVFYNASPKISLSL